MAWCLFAARGGDRTRLHNLGQTWHMEPLAAEAPKLQVSMIVGFLPLELACARTYHPGVFTSSRCLPVLQIQPESAREILSVLVRATEARCRQRI